MKIRTVGTELFHEKRGMDGRMGKHDVANNRFSQCCERT